MDIDTLLSEYRAILADMYANRSMAEKPTKWNRLVDALQRVQLQLREVDAGRAGITALIEDDNYLVAMWSAGYALSWAPDMARPVLERMASTGGPGSLEAKYTLREFDAGRLTNTWQPKSKK